MSSAAEAEIEFEQIVGLLSNGKCFNYLSHTTITYLQ